MEQPFHMFEVTKDLVKEILLQPSKPHRHQYEELLILTQGEPEHFIDFIREKVFAPVVIYVAQGKVHEFVPDVYTRGWVIRYRNDFIPGSNFHFYSRYTDRIAFSFDPGRCRQQIGNLCDIMLYEYVENPSAVNVYNHLFRALLAKLEAEGKHKLPVGDEKKPSRRDVFKVFLEILENNYTRNEGVGFYADKLNTSVRNLNLLCSKEFGKSVSEIIETRKLIEARQLLLNTEMNISEIGYSLGYNEKSYFTRVFSRKTGLTPSEFRLSMQS
ncbi:MAG: AraC family transcriptional regulator [Bacteroidota bacterium]